MTIKIKLSELKRIIREAMREEIVPYSSLPKQPLEGPIAFRTKSGDIFDPVQAYFTKKEIAELSKRGFKMPGPLTGGHSKSSPFFGREDHMVLVSKDKVSARRPRIRFIVYKMLTYLNSSDYKNWRDRDNATILKTARMK